MGAALIGLGCLLGCAGYYWVCVQACRESPSWALAVASGLGLPVFAALRWSRASRPCLLILAGVLLVVCGVLAATPSPS